MDNKVDLKSIIERYSEMIYHIATRYMENIEDAEDTVQEVFIKYINYLKIGKKFNDENHEKFWIIKVTMSICINERNTAWKRKTVPLKEGKNIECVGLSEIFLSEYIKQLKEKYRIVLELFYIKDLEIKEIGKILSLTESNVKARLKRAKKQLKDLLDKNNFFN